MGFDDKDNQPLVRPRRWGTKVNFGMALGIAVFLIFGGVVAWRIDHKRPEVSSSPPARAELSPP